MPEITYILFPGRHHLLTNFQFEYLRNVAGHAGAEITDLYDNRYRLAAKPSIIWAITSANHSGTRRNPLPASKREVAIERFSRELPAQSFAFTINDLGPTERFADHMIKDIGVQSRGEIHLSPENTLVASSTPSVIELFHQLGYGILPVELSKDRQSFSHLRPWDLVTKIVEAGSNWRHDPTYEEQVHPESRAVLEKYNYGDYIIELHNDPLVGDEGDITETRDYNTYGRAFDDGADRKYELVRDYLRPGRIVDIGCATGAVVKKLSEDYRLRESDLYGIEVARKLYETCQQRLSNGEFSNENTFFFQRNIARGKIFPDDSVQTTLTFSLTHEIESYIGREALLDFLQKIYDQTARGGVYVNVDVVGPENKDELVYAAFNREDGQGRSDEAHRRALQGGNLREYLDSLSTHERFLQFAEDFRRDESGQIQYSNESDPQGNHYIVAHFGDVCEFLSKKDYTDNWQSEMHETFCFWSFQDWCEALSKVGFAVTHDSRAYQNPWIVKNRFENKVGLFRKGDSGLEQLPYPPTNMIIVAEKI